MKDMLIAYGFQQDWIERVMNLTPTTFFSILLNGAPTRTFIPSHGMKQGDPLSPFMFILMAEGMGKMIKNMVETWESKGMTLHVGEDKYTYQ